jgi:hypothetical protein
VTTESRQRAGNCRRSSRFEPRRQSRRVLSCGQSSRGGHHARADNTEIGDLNAPAEIFSSAGQGAARGPMLYRRFASGAQAIRYAIEELPAALLRGSIIQVDDDRFDARRIRELYDCPAYPLARVA